MRQQNRRFAIKGISIASDGFYPERRRSEDTIATKTLSDVVQGLVEVGGFFVIFKHIDLVIPFNQMGKPNTN